MSPTHSRQKDYIRLDKTGIPVVSVQNNPGRLCQENDVPHHRRKNRTRLTIQ